MESWNGIMRKRRHGEQEWSKEGKGDMESRSGVRKKRIHGEQEGS
jgi:hypothetical protein